MGDPFEGLFDTGDVLDRVAVDITAQARRGDLEPVRCRDPEIARVVDILLRQSKNNPALVGKAGVGKTAIVEGLAQRIATGDVPPALKDARVLILDHVALLAGSTRSASAGLCARSRRMRISSCLWTSCTTSSARGLRWAPRWMRPTC